MIFGIFPNLEKEGINLVLQRLISILDDLGTPYKFLVSMKQKIENLGLDLGESYVSIEELAQDRKSTRLNSSHNRESRMPSSA